MTARTHVDGAIPERAQEVSRHWLLPRDSLDVLRLNDMLEVGAIEGLVTGSKIYMRYDTYTERGVRVHVRRLQDMMQPSVRQLRHFLGDHFSHLCQLYTTPHHTRRAICSTKCPC